MMWPFVKKEEYIQVPKSWAETLSAVCEDAQYGFQTTEIRPTDIIAYASKITRYLNGEE